MPGSILINDGRRSASPDRRVTFGNIERYDIMTSNEMKDIKSNRGDVPTINGNYPMTRLDNRIRKAVMLGFTETPGDTVAYEEIVTFLLEFKVIVNAKLCNERQITAIIQSSFPKCVVKPSVKHNVLYHNLENRSDEVVKEELVRVTTEPIINPYTADKASLEASAWIKEENESDMSDGEDTELSEIENKKVLKEKAEASLQYPSGSVSPTVELTSDTPTYMHQNKMKSNAEYDTKLDHVTFDSQELKSGDHMSKELPVELSATIRDLIAATNRQTQEILKRKSEGIEQQEAVKSTGKIKSPPPMNTYVRTPSPVEERAIDVPDHAHSAGNKDGSTQMVNKSLSKDDSQISVKRTSSFSNSNLGRSKSVQDMAKKFEQSNDSKSSLQRKRSFTRSTDRSFVGSIRDRFKSKSKDTDKGSKADDNTKKKVKKDEAVVKVKSTATIKITTTPKANRKVETNVNNTTKNINDTRNTTRTSSLRKNEFGGSSPDVRNSFRNKSNVSSSTTVINKTPSTHDVRSSFRASNTNLTSTKSSTRSTGQLNKQNDTSPFQRSVTTSKSNQNNEVRSSLRRSAQDSNNDPRSSIRGNNSSTVRTSIRKPSNEDSNDVRSSFRKNTVDKNNVFQYGRGSSVRTSTRSASASSTPRGHTSNVRSGSASSRTSFRESNTSSPVKRSNSRLSSQNSSKNSSNSSTPTMSRENSKTNFKTPSSTATKNKKPTKKVCPQEKDFVRIATAFQQASNVIDKARDNIEQFMIQIATDDIEEATNNRLKLDDLYDHIRHRMIIAKDAIFDGRQNDVTVDMSQYFNLLFKTLAAHFNRIGCEVITNKINDEKVCYLIHVKLVDYVDDLQALSEATVVQISDDDEEGEATYV